MDASTRRSTMILRRSLATFFCLAMAASGLAMEHHLLLDEATADLLHEVLSGEMAKDHVLRLIQHHRIQGSRDYRDSANYVLEQLRGYGFSDKQAFIESYASD